MQKDHKRQIEKELKNWFKAWRREYPTTILDEIERFTLAGGKRMRPNIMITTYLGWGGSDLKSIIKASCCWELLHSYFLIHDDILDQDELRRGQATVWVNFTEQTNNKHQGESLAILAGDLAANLAYDAIMQFPTSDDKKNKALKIFRQIASDVLYGQILDMELQKQINFTEKDISQVHIFKTAKYTLEGPLQLGAVLAGVGEQKLKLFSAYALPAGRAFQIQDDILGVFGNKKETGKPVGSDLREGKKTLLIAKALELASPEDKNFIISKLGQANLSLQDINKIREIIEKTGSLAYSQQLSRELVTKSQKALKKLKLPKKQNQELYDLAEYIIARSS